MTLKLEGGLGSLVSEKAVDNGDPVFTKEELDRFSYGMLRNLAANSNTGEINGKSTRLQIRAYFYCQRSLFEYVDE